MTFRILSQPESEVTTIGSWTSTAEIDAHAPSGIAAQSVASLWLVSSATLGTSSASAASLITEADEDFVDLDEAVAKLDQDPAMQDVMVRARQWAATALYGEERDSLKALRLARGLSQDAFARSMKTSQATVSKWERGRVDMRVSTMQRIAQVLGVEVSDVCYAICHSFSVEEAGHG
jgi:DNA-binding transcriptional regulator YiaG